MTAPNQEILRQIPSVDDLLQDAALQACSVGVPQQVVTDSVRGAIEETRERLCADASGAPTPESIRAVILQRTQERIQSAMGPHYCKVINATGIILHTALGRAVLARQAIKQITDELSGYSRLQADADTGKRSKRDERIEWLLRRLTGAEAATVVNNNAAATSIVLNTVAAGREVIVSRGQLVEIGGSFRLPDVMEASGVTLVEVGTTNKTHARDYERAITENTAAILRVHPSNYRIVGFTSEVPLGELVRIARTYNLVTIDDVGAGALLDLSRVGFPDEPMLPDSIRDGADLITASADKLIGAAQGGIILGRADLIDAVRKSPLARILRVDKLTLAVLEATLTLFLDEHTACHEIPTFQMLLRDRSDIARHAERIAASVRQHTDRAVVSTIDGFSQMGSGSLPERNIATRLVAIRSEAIEPAELAQRLRRGRPPVFARIHKQQLLVDPRTVLPGEEPVLIEALVASLTPDGA